MSKANRKKAPTSQTLIRLPVITGLKLDGYILFPGRDGSFRLKHTFPPGVSVIVGVNGQGKTTLLNILFRTLVGAWDQSKADYAQPGRRQHELTALKRFDYFTSRIGGEDTAASAEVTVQFGKEIVRIQRSLGRSLKIEALWHGKQEIDSPDEDKWLTLVEQLSGLSGRYDFHFVVRHFLFFLEDKLPLLWNPYGQFEILRILFLERSVSERCVELHDKILQDDSIFRNLQWQNGMRVDRLRQLKEELGLTADATDAIETLAVLAERVSAAEHAAESSVKEVEDILARVEEYEATLFGKQIALSNAKAELELAERQYLKRAFPNVDQITELVFGYLLAGDRCLVCGSEHHNAASHLRERLAQHHCPACDSPLDDEVTRRGAGKFDTARLEKFQREAGQLEKEISKAEQELRTSRAQLADGMGERERAQRVLMELRLKRYQAENRQDLPAEFAGLEREVDESRRNLREKAASLKHLRSEYEEVLAGANERIEGVAAKILDKFQSYADKFLLEKTSLSYDLHERAVGQSGQKLRFPNFVVSLASTATAEPTERPEIDQVSESQREFVDLAFRMALLDVAVSALGPTMIAVETPEASLDAVFIERAGLMLRAFAKAHPENRVIATSNVNGENMIGWLLGTVGRSPRDIPLASLSRYLLNLLEEGRPTRAYEKERAVYNRALKRAIYGS